MKKQLTTAVLAFMLLLTTTGCSGANAVQKLDAAEDRIETRLDAAGDKLENSLRNAASPTHTAAESTENTRVLTKEQAQEIALEHVGFTADQVTQLRTEYEIDDGVPQFDVEFYQGDWEYEFEIHAQTGKIISYDKDHKYD